MLTKEHHRGVGVATNVVRALGSGFVERGSGELTHATGGNSLLSQLGHSADAYLSLLCFLQYLESTSITQAGRLSPRQSVWDQA